MTAKIKVPRGQRLKDITAFCMMGATNLELADFLKVSLSTFERWLRDEVKVQKAMLEGKTLADARVGQALYSRATGAEVWEEKAVVADGVSEVLTLKKKIPPDTAAAFIWLKNRRPDRWRDRSETLNVNIDAKADLTEMLKEYARRHGLEAAKAIAEHHGYSGVLIEGEAEVVEQAS